MESKHQDDACIEQGVGDSPVQEDAIDSTALVELRDLQEAGEPDLLHELIEMFITDAEPRLTSLRTAIAQGDAPMVEREAHALKGSCANFGAQPMVRICHDLQVLGRSHALTTAPGLLAHLEAEYTRVRAALTAVMAKDGYAHSDR